jgi:hypothetical protein
MKWIVDDSPPDNTLIFGNSKGAELEVTVVTTHLERYVEYRCLCAACEQVEAIGLEEAMGERLADGIHYVETWHEVHRGFEYTEHDAGLRHTQEDNDA